MLRKFIKVFEHTSGGDIALAQNVDSDGNCFLEISYSIEDENGVAVFVIRSSFDSLSEMTDHFNNMTGDDVINAVDTSISLREAAG